MILDILELQVHQGKAPKYLNEEPKFIESDVGGMELTSLLKKVDAVMHLAVFTGVRESM